MPLDKAGCEKSRLEIDWFAPPGSDIRISNQFLITRALHFAQLRQAYYQASVIITLGRRV